MAIKKKPPVKSVPRTPKEKMGGVSPADTVRRTPLQKMQISRGGSCK